MTTRPTDRHPTVLLRHELPDGSWHVDWLLAREGDPDARLVTFRLPARVDEITPGERVDAERIADHRSLYLDYEGPVRGDRGRVERLVRGTIECWREMAEAWEIELAWCGRDGDATPRRQRLRLTERGETRWVVFAF